jgi:DNA polymerase delta subunit 1
MVEGEKQVIPSQPHVQVLEKINERTPGAHPHTGDRVPFVLVKHEDPRAKMFEKAEDPQYAKNTEGVELDYNYYFTNQLKKPIEDLLDPLIHGEDIFATMMPPKPPRKQKPAPKNNRTITEMFKAKDRCISK